MTENAELENEIPDEIDNVIDEIEDAIANAKSLLIALVIDRSASMDPVARETISGINEFLDDQQSQPGTTLVTMTLFNTVFDVRYAAVDIDEVKRLDYDSYSPMGMTALLDAVGYTITETERALAQLATKPDKVLVVIQTDGEENSSREYTYESINKLISRKTEQGWDFAFLSAGPDAWATGQRLGVARHSTQVYAGTGGGTRSAMASMSSSTTAYRQSAGGQGFTWSSNLDDPDENPPPDTSQTQG